MERDMTNRIPSHHVSTFGAIALDAHRFFPRCGCGVTSSDLTFNVLTVIEIKWAENEFLLSNSIEFVRVML